MSVIDLGGTVEGWAGAPVVPKRLVMVNPDSAMCLGDGPSADMESLEVLEADACSLSADLRGQFDLTFSNSVIEHVGGHDRRLEFAEAVMNLAPRYWVQTPYRYFPIEPHVLFPFFQQLPTRLRAEIRRHWMIGWGGRHGMTLDEAITDVLTVELLDRTQMRHYFPGAEIFDERFLGLRKSVIAIRRY
jgi:hypothetical protein